MTSTLNAGIDVIWDTFQPTLETLRKQLNAALGRSGFNPTLHSDSRAEARPTSTLEWQEWEIPREADAKWPDAAKQAHKENKIDFIALEPWPGKLICAEGRFIQSAGVASDTSVEGADKKRAAIFIGSEFGTVTRVDLAAAAREAAEADFDVLIACAFSFDAHASELGKLGRIRVLQARMNADPHMAEDLKNTGKGNLFVIFGEPDITILDQNQPQIRVKVNGVDVFHPNSGEIRSDGADGIACWFIDTDYNEESFLAAHPRYADWRIEFAAIAPRMTASDRQTLLGMDVLPQDLVELTQGL